MKISSSVHENLDLFHAGLDQAQMSSLEAVETAECPNALVVLCWIVVGAFGDFGSDFGLILVLSQLLDQVLNIESFVIGEQSHFLEDAMNVAFGLVILGEVPFLVFVDQLFGDVEGLSTFWPVFVDVLEGLDLPFWCFVGVGL